jgi:hypothetical protein
VQRVQPLQSKKRQSTTYIASPTAYEGATTLRFNLFLVINRKMQPRQHKKSQGLVRRDISHGHTRAVHRPLRLLTPVFSAVRNPLTFTSFLQLPKADFPPCDWWDVAYHKYKLAVAREVLKHVYAAERLQPPLSLSAVLGTYGTLWARARSIRYWRDVVRSGDKPVWVCTPSKRTAFSRWYLPLFHLLWGC